MKSQFQRKEIKMTGKEYQKLAMRTNDGNTTARLQKFVNIEQELINNNISDKHMISTGEILNACLGLSGEVGEFNDMIKKWIFHEKELDEDHLKKECGDIMWYIAMMCHAFKWNLDEIMQMNINKLRTRYPEGFDVVKANNREDSDI